MFKTKRSHQQFQEFLQEQLVNCYALSLFFKTLFSRAQAILKVYLTDLTPVRDILKSSYNPRGQTPWDPVVLFRSYWLMVQYQTSGSITDWVARLREEPFWAILSGFEPGNTPGIGTFYDFESRLCNFDLGQRSSRIKKMRKHRAKPKKKLKQNEKLPSTNQGIVDKIVERIIRDEEKPLPVRADDDLQSIFKSCFVTPSVNKGLIPNDTYVSGDGTLVATGGSPYGIKDCGCRKQGIFRCDCPRRFSDPDANWGWDSYRECYVYGYANYTFTASGKYELPIYSTLAQASRHDSVTLVCSLHKMHNFYPEFEFSGLILDKAHDNYATYELLNHLGIEPFIPLKKSNNGNFTYPPALDIDADGTPICRAGFKMANWGFQKDRCRIKWRCPAKVYKNCCCDNPCSPSDYGRTIYTKPDWDPRLFTPTPRKSHKWKKVMRKRTAAERRNKRVKKDYNLEQDRVRSKSRWLIRTVLRDAALHADAWVEDMDTDAQDWLSSWWPEQIA